DPSRILGQDNLFQYRSYMGICLRIQPSDKPLDILRSMAAALTCETPIQISYTQGKTPLVVSDQWKHLLPLFRIVEETEDHFLQRVQAGAFKRIRLLSPADAALQLAAAESACHLDFAPVLTNGRFELLHYLREIAISFDYHRYGNLGVREGEVRKPIF
ncbi:MAG TPA: hypothetical protein VLE96_00065, partial [Chlamydiales bacterium]|nr:hypothetical protein [Chlamydiales bacterium]